ncbi:MAG: tetratricopeptide repeat protein, partial [Anaerolineaceae bacterium]|nr:tetratricopeptide repeat protein [Anaerolineaceae bacterium]
THQPVEVALAKPFTAFTAQSMLSALDHANLFLTPLDNRQEWYRYHRLFSELLQRQLVQTRGADLVRELHRRASFWFEQAGLWNEAVDHALHAGDEKRAVDLVDQHATQLFEASEMPAVREWILRLPEPLIYSRLSLCISLAWAAIATAHEDEAGRAVLAIERALGLDENITSLMQFTGADLPAGFVIILINVGILRSTLDITALELQRSVERSRAALAFLEQLPGEEYAPIVINFNCVAFFNIGVCCQMLGDVVQACDALEKAVEYSDLSQNPHILSMAISHLAQIYASQGKLSRAFETYQLSLRRTAEKSPKPSPLSCLTHSGLGMLALERNDLEEAQTQFERCLELGVPWNAWEALIPAYMGLANLYRVRKEPARALAYLDQANLAWERTHHRGPLLEFEAWRALITEDHAALAACANKFEQADPPQDNVLVYIVEDILHLQAQLWLQMGDLTKADEILSNVRASAEKGARWGVVIRNLILRSILHELNHSPS